MPTLKRLETHCMLTPVELEPSDPRMRVAGAFNPGVAEHDGEVVLLVRVVEEAVEQREGYASSPRVDAATGELGLDWLDVNQLDMSDPRVYLHKPTNINRLRFISHFRVFYSKDGKTVDRAGVRVTPQGPYEIFGIEDPRITRLGDVYYITYVAVSDRGICTCMMSTRDFQTFERHGVILPPDNKDVILFPEKIRGRYVMLHRPMPSLRFNTPQIWLAYSDDLIHWGGHHRLLGGDSASSDRIGGGAAPVRTDRGWLTIYHGNERLPVGEGGALRVCYTGGALMLDLDDPSKLLAQTHEPIITPTEPYETHGFVNNVIFPTAVLERDDRYLVYCGAADENISVIAYDKAALLATLA